MSKRSRRKARYARQGRKQRQVPLGEVPGRMSQAMAEHELAAATKTAERLERQQALAQATPKRPWHIAAPKIENQSSMADWSSGVPGTEGYNQQHRVDPARDFVQAPPNFSRYAIPQVLTFQGIVASIAKAYRNWDEAVKDSPDNARFMRNDPSVMECIKARQRCVALLNWHLELDGPKLPAHEALKERMTRILRKTPHFTKYRQSLLEAIWFGRAANQHIYSWSLRGGNHDLVIGDWRPVHGDKIVFRMDDGKNQYPRDQIGFRVGMQFKQGDLVLGRKLEPTQAGLATFLAPYERHLVCLHKHEVEDAAYETPLDAGSIHGVGIRSQIYWCWFQKIEFQALLVEFMERAALGFEIWYYPEGNEQAVLDLQTAARNRVGRRNFLLFPVPTGVDPMASPYDVKVIEANMSGAESLRSLLEGYFGHQIKRFILGQILTSEAEATGLGSGVADLHYQTLLDIVKYDATNLEETITQELLYPLGRLNDRHFDDIDVRFVLETHSPDVMEKLDAFQKAWQIGTRLKESDVLEAISASVPNPDDYVLQNPQAAPPQAPPGAGQGGPPGPGGMPASAEAPPDQFASPQAAEADLAQQAAEALPGGGGNGQPPGQFGYRENRVARYIDQEAARYERMLAEEYA